MKNFRRKWGRMLLPALLVLSAAAFSAAGFVGRDSLYSKYEDKFPEEPWLTLVFQGAHDRIWPWELVTVFAAPPEAGYAGAEPSDTETADALTAADGAGAEGQAHVEVLPEGEKDDTVPEIDPRYATIPSSGNGRIPEGAGDPVMDAVDYGSWEPSFLSPPDTEYNTDKEGPFAVNGVFYPLQSVDREYFSDALFIGDSRTQGLWEYGGLKDTASFCCRESVTTFNLLDEELDYGRPGQATVKSGLRQVLEQDSFRKIYISLGINEVGYPNTYIYYENYREILALIRELQPDAIIYIQGMLHVTAELSRTNIALNNTIVVQRNRAVSTLANGRDIFYLDMNPEFCDGNGDLLPENTGDGVHLMGAVCGAWADYLQGHAVLRGPEDEGTGQKAE